MRGVGYVAFSPRPVAEWIAAETLPLQNICFPPPPKDVRRLLFPTRYIVSLRTPQAAQLMSSAYAGRIGRCWPGFHRRFCSTQRVWIDIVRFKKLINGALQLALTRNHKWA